MKMRALALGAFLGLSCGDGAAFPIAFVQSPGPVADGYHREQPTFVAGAPADHVKILGELDRAAASVVSSTQFQRTLEDIDAMQAMVDGPPSSGLQVAHRYLGRGPRSEVLPIKYAVSGSKGSTTATTDLLGDYALVTVSSVVLQRYASKSIASKACAINTVAHEWAHAVVGEDRAHNDFQFYQDGGHNGGPPLVSYTVGALAQCLYLIQNGYRGLDLSCCIDTVGTTTFHHATCTDAFWKSTGGAPGPCP